MHHLVSQDFTHIANNTLLVGILTIPQFAFNVHEVTFDVVASAFGYVVCEITKDDNVMPVGLFHPIVIAITITFRSGQGNGDFFASTFGGVDFWISPKSSYENDFI